MEKYIIHSGIIAFVYLFLKFIEMRMVQKESKAVKDLVRDTIIVYLAAMVGLYIISEFMPTTTVDKVITNVFTDAPGF
jgi:hypothetical protein